VAGKQRSAAPPGRRRCRQPAVPARMAVEKEVSEPFPHGTRLDAQAEVEGGTVVSPPTVERREWRRPHLRMASGRREVVAIAGG